MTVDHLVCSKMFSLSPPSNQRLGDSRQVVEGVGREGRSGRSEKNCGGSLIIWDATVEDISEPKLVEIREISTRTVSFSGCFLMWGQPF